MQKVRQEKGEVAWVMPIAQLDLHRIALGLQSKELYAFKSLDSYAALANEGRIPEPKKEEWQICSTHVVSTVIALSHQTDLMLINHALNSLAMLLSRPGSSVVSAVVDKCERIFSSIEYSVESRILAGKVLVCVSEEMIAPALGVLRTLPATLNPPELAMVKICLTLIGRSVTHLDAKDFIFVILPVAMKLVHSKQLVLPCLGLIHGILEIHADEIANLNEPKILTWILVEPLIALLEAGQPEFLEAAVSIILKIGVHDELRKVILPCADRLTAFVWKRELEQPEVPVMMQSIWNVVTELFLLA